MANKIIQGIRFPFELNNTDNYYLDVDTNYFETIKSKIKHLLLTEKGQKIRDPEFGINLHDLLFNQNDETTHTDIQNTIVDTIMKYVPNIKIKEFKVDKLDINSLKINVEYIIDNGTYEYYDKFEIIIK